MESTPDAPVLVLTHDAALAETALAAAAAVDVPAVHEQDVGLLARTWRAVVVGVDTASAAARHGPGEPGTLHLVGRHGDEEQLCAWSSVLGAATTVLPDGVRGLSASLAGATRGHATVLGVVGGVGGAGASTLAVALAELAARRGRRTLLVDLDPRGGGLDLALGLERTPGWRWSGLAAARGFVGDLGANLPSADGLDVLAWDRDPGAETPQEAAVATVLRSAARTHDVVVVDLSRGDPALGGRVDLCEGTLLVAPSTVRGLAGARRVVAAIDPVAPLALVARAGALPGTEVARGLGIPLLGDLPDDPAVALAGDRGEPASRAAGRRLRRALDVLADRVLGEG